uniref:Uncharacterized protein n=1 Tax=Rhizophora mucronata TaxID=61149 RepID=A0A2P2R2J9_RHIMU
MDNCERTVFLILNCVIKFCPCWASVIHNFGYSHHQH